MAGRSSRDRSQQTAVSHVSNTIDRLIEWNAALEPEHYLLADMRRIVDANSDQIRIMSGSAAIEIRSSDVLYRDMLLSLRGFSKDSLPELRLVGLVPRKLAREHVFFGCQLIAFFCGNLRLVSYLQRLDRQPRRTRKRGTSTS